MARMPEHIKQRLDRWQLWSLTGCGGGPRLPIYLRERVDCSFIDGATMPTDVEALETEAAVNALPLVLRKRVRHVYTSKVGNTIEGYAAQLRIAASTLKLSLAHAGIRIDVWLQEKHAAALERKNNFGNYSKRA